MFATLILLIKLSYLTYFFKCQYEYAIKPPLLKAFAVLRAYIYWPNYVKKNQQKYTTSTKYRNRVLNHN